MDHYILAVFSALLILMGAMVAAAWVNFNRRIDDAEMKSKLMVAAILKLNMRWYPEKAIEIAEIMTSLLENGKK